MARPEPNDFARPLATALSQLAFTLESENQARVIVARRTENELYQQDLPAHVEITSRPLRGRRVPVRGVKNFRISRLVLADWPDDGLDEAALHSLNVVVSGQADLVAGDYVIHCYPGDVVLLPAGVPKGNGLPNVTGKNAQRSCNVLKIYPGRLYGEGLECWIIHSQAGKIEVGLKQGGALVKNRSLAQLFGQLCDEMLREPVKKRILYHFLLSFVLLLHHELDTGRSFMPDIRRLRLPVEQTSDFAVFVKAYIESNLDTHLTVEVMARQLVMSPTSFKQHFREVMGVTFHEYLTNSRAEFAAILLQNTDLKVESIAEKVGLKYSQFRKLILAKYGCTPGSYRKQRKDV